MDAAIPKERYMKFPYTIGAKMFFFPYKHHYKHCWTVKYWLIAMAFTVPVYWKITKMVNSPENVEKTREARRKLYSPHH